jgi:hypothetical protein
MMSMTAVTVQLFVLVCSGLVTGRFQLQSKIGVAAQLLAEAVTIVVFPSLSKVYIVSIKRLIPLI